VASCWSCGNELPPAARFCSYCGARVRDVLEVHEERKVVCVLFVDLVGSTAQADRRDPEDVRATLVPFYDGLRADIERFGGRVEKFIGDAVLALFGAPLAHEDDPERAVRAALDIRGTIAQLNAQPGSASRCASPSRPARPSSTCARSRRGTGWRPATS
jgi:class 3 adenylate cyclase